MGAKNTKKGLAATALIGTVVLLSHSSEKESVFSEEMNSTTGYFRCQRRHPGTMGGGAKGEVSRSVSRSFSKHCPHFLICPTAPNNLLPISLVPQKCAAYANYLRYALCFGEKSHILP